LDHFAEPQPFLAVERNYACFIGKQSRGLILILMPGDSMGVPDSGV